MKKLRFGEELLLKELNIPVYERLLLIELDQHPREYFYSKISLNDTILLHGGGNFGDLFRGQNRRREQLMKYFPHNKFIIFPQTIFYLNQSLIEIDNKGFSTISDLTISTRSIQSFELAQKSFPNNKILLLPDIAFMIGPIKALREPNVDIFILRRIDKEKNFKQQLWASIIKEKLDQYPNVSFKVCLDLSLVKS